MGESGVFPADIFPPWLSILISPGDEQQSCWWPQFRDIISSHRHEEQQDTSLSCTADNFSHTSVMLRHLKNHFGFHKAYQVTTSTFIFVP
jgi:hypothetical protein